MSGTIHLDAGNFFKYFMFDPGSDLLTKQDQNIAKLATILLGICTLGITHIICRCFFYDKAIVQLQPKDNPKITQIADKVLKPYQDSPIKALDWPCNFSERIAKYPFHRRKEEFRRQFDTLGETYYFQRARGGGNCFYLSYASGVLHHLFLHKDEGAFSNAIRFLESKKNIKERDAAIEVLRQLEQSPSVETLYQILTSEESIQPFIDYLRAFAIEGVRNNVDQEKTRVLKRTVLEWSGDDLAPIMLDNEDVQKAIAKEKQKDPNIDDKEAYLRYQAQDGTDIQRPEIGVIHTGLWPLALCLQIDDPLLKQSQVSAGNGFLEDYPLATSTVQLFRTGNHFDALIPKNVFG